MPRVEGIASTMEQERRSSTVSEGRETKPIRNRARKGEIGGIEGPQEGEIVQSIHCKLRVPPPKSGSSEARDIDPNDTTILARDANPD